MLAQQYGFDSEELDFINYDINYRMGRVVDDGEHTDMQLTGSAAR